jgi:hypothetical protein
VRELREYVGLCVADFTHRHEGHEGTKKILKGLELNGSLLRVLVASSTIAVAPGCQSSTEPSAPFATVRIVFRGSTSLRSELPPSAQACVSGVGTTHTHPSWRNFSTVPLQPVPPDRYEITFSDVPVDVRVSFRINDQNYCDQNATGAVLRGVSANDVELVQNTTTPGNGEEPGFAFSVSPRGRVTQ